MKTIKKIVITGGPCSGKSTMLNLIENTFKEKGYKVLIVSETATELIRGGISPLGGKENMFIFQDYLLNLQFKKEEVYEKAAAEMDADKIIILYDRGLLDNKAYVSKEEFEVILDRFGTTENELIDRYDLVLHLVTTANGAEEHYTLANNAARSESLDDARKLDELTMNAWVGHPRLRIFDNSTDFEGKVERVLKEIYNDLDEHMPTSTIRKYLVDVENIDIDSIINTSEKMDIVQHYLKSSNPNMERRIRQIGNGENYSYYYTEKEKVNNHRTFRREKKISDKLYLTYLSEIDNQLFTIIKTRHCFVYENQYFKLDIFNNDKKYGILEIEATDQNGTILLPEFLNIKADVTKDSMYSNYEISKRNYVGK